jgi:hypothetical protein
LSRAIKAPHLGFLLAQRLPLVIVLENKGPEEYWKAGLPVEARVTAAQDSKEIDAVAEHIRPMACN